MTLLSQRTAKTIEWQKLPERHNHPQCNTDTLKTTQPEPSDMWSIGDAEFSQPTKTDEGGKWIRTMKNEDNMKENHSIVLLCIFRIIPGRQDLLQALPLQKKRKANVVHTEIDPSQTDVQPNTYLNGFQSNRGTTCHKILIGRKTYKSYPYRWALHQVTNEQNSAPSAKWSFIQKV